MTGSAGLAARLSLASTYHRVIDPASGQIYPRDPSNLYRNGLSLFHQH